MGCATLCGGLHFVSKMVNGGIYKVNEHSSDAHFLYSLNLKFNFTIISSKILKSNALIAQLDRASPS